MIFKGVTSGKDKGNPIEYQPVEKFPLAAKVFLHKTAPEGKLYLFEKVEIATSTFSPLDIPNWEYPFQKNSYKAEGKIWYKINDLEKDTLTPVKSGKFEIEFKDKVTNGMPDLELISMKLL